METIINYVDSTFNKKERSMLPIITAATVLLFTTYRLHAGYRKYEKKNKKGYREIPVPGSRYPYFGHMLSLGSLPSKKISEWHGELGPIIQLHMGVHNWVSVDDPILAHKIFVTRGVETSYRPHSAYAYHHYSLEGKGIGFAQPDKGWREARSAVVSVLAPRQIEKYMDSINEKANTMISRLIRLTETEKSVDPRLHLELYSLNVISSACFGKTYESINDPEFIKLSNLIIKSMGLAGIEHDLPNFLPAFAIFDYFAGTQEKMKKFIRDNRDPVCKELVEFAKNQEGPNIVKAFEENGFHLEGDYLTVMMFDLMGGGTDTVSLTLAWNIAILCNYPQVQKQAAAEIDEFVKLNGRLPHFNERTQLPYCISVMKECMRFRPTTAFGIPHAVYEDVEVDGYVIPKGATLITSMQSLHKNPDLYPDPERFRPERFIDNIRTMQASANGKLEERDHFNFGWGRRICPAIYLAEVETFSTFVRMLSQSFIEPESMDEMPNLNNALAAGINLKPVPYKVKFVRRTDNKLNLPY